MKRDFGRILDQWESRPAGQARQAAADMDALLRRYPPEDKDAADTADTASDRRHQPHPERLPVEASLDLHGFRLDEAIAATDAFIERSAASGMRKVLIIHGKGENGQGVLRREIRSHLERNPLTGAMGYNRGSEGGRGALWVVLRKGGEGEPAAHRSR